MSNVIHLFPEWHPRRNIPKPKPKNISNGIDKYLRVAKDIFDEVLIEAMRNYPEHIARHKANDIFMNSTNEATALSLFEEVLCQKMNERSTRRQLVLQPRRSMFDGYDSPPQKAIRKAEPVLPDFLK